MALLAVTASAQQPKEDVELMMWNLPENPPSNAGQAMWVTILQNFQKANPNIKIVAGGGPQLQKFGRGTR